MKTNWQRLKTLKVNQQFALISSVLLILCSGYIVDKIDDINLAWQTNLNLYRLSFLLIILTIESRVKEIAVALLINHFIDRFFGINGWSCNDSITIIFIIYKVVKKWKVLS
jgi:hypothetical protein